MLRASLRFAIGKILLRDGAVRDGSTVTMVEQGERAAKKLVDSEAKTAMEKRSHVDSSGQFFPALAPLRRHRQILRAKSELLDHGLAQLA